LPAVIRFHSQTRESDVTFVHRVDFGACPTSAATKDIITDIHHQELSKAE